MFAQLGARLSAVRSVAGARYDHRFKVLAGLVAMAVTLGGCLPTTGPLVGADPADPSARVAPVGYRSVVSPYVSLRPTTPKAWREQKDRAASPNSSQQEREK